MAYLLLHGVSGHVACGAHWKIVFVVVSVAVARGLLNHCTVTGTVPGGYESVLWCLVFVKVAAMLCVSWWLVVPCQLTLCLLRSVHVCFHVPPLVDVLMYQHCITRREGSCFLCAPVVFVTPQAASMYALVHVCS